MNMTIDVKKLLILMTFFLLSGINMVYAKNLYKNLYTEAFTHFYDEVLYKCYGNGDTICIKQVFGITDFFPKEIKGHPIRIVNEFDCENIPKNKLMQGVAYDRIESDSGTIYREKHVSYYVHQIYYIYPMSISFVNETLRISVEINVALYWEDDKREMRDPYTNNSYYVDFMYNKEANDVVYCGMGGGGCAGPVPWIFR